MGMLYRSAGQRTCCSVCVHDVAGLVQARCPAGPPPLERRTRSEREDERR
eukprot:COSAG02_NODE_49983_length_323_cov_0.928571_1_plen_49_part_01